MKQPEITEAAKAFFTGRWPLTAVAPNPVKRQNYQEDLLGSTLIWSEKDRVIGPVEPTELALKLYGEAQ